MIGEIRAIRVEMLRLYRARVDRLIAAATGRPRLVASRLPHRMWSSITRRLRMRQMTDEEKFSFDLEGYLILRQVLAADEVAALGAIASQQCVASDGAAYTRLFGASRWGPPYQALIDHPRIVPYLDQLLGSKFRLDHDYCLRMTKGGRDQDLHGGATSRNADHWYAYRDGVIRCGLTVVEFFLTPARPGDGGFCCIPGSHKSNFLSSLPRDVRQYERVPHYVVQPAVEAGDAIIFTESLVHGTMPWSVDGERLAVLYKYSPGHSAWMRPYYDLNDYPNLTEQQRRILAPPSVGERPDSIGGGK
jgi:hypothetical protein